MILKDLKGKIIFIILIGILILVSLFSMSMGSVKISFHDIYEILGNKLFNLSLSPHIQQSTVDIIWQIRFPRVVLGAVVGIGLALCGVVMQATVQNPLADPYILGISSGGTLGATFSVLVFSVYFSSSSISLSISVAAFIGALLSSIVVFKISTIGGRMTPVKLVLSGVVVNFICTAFSSLMIYMSNDNGAVRSISDWTMGSLAGATLKNINLPLISVILIGGFFLTQSRILNIMLLGDESAITLGVDLNKYRKIYLLLTAFLTGIMVASCGIIGFVGLVIPHITRSLVGTNHKINTPCAMLIGGIFLMLSDIVARSLLTSMELPIGIITSIIGAPFFMYILIKKSYSFGGA